MDIRIEKIIRSPMLLLWFACVLVLFIFLWQGNQGFSLADEGFLWYGAKRVMLGEVPIRDFMSYDPGRYYWSAALMSIWGNNGIMALRGSVAVFQAIGLFVGLMLISATLKTKNLLYSILSAMILLVWMQPRHKLFDISLSILLVGILYFLVQKPTNKRYFYAGFGLGLVAVFGRNHAIYGLVGSVGVMLWLAMNRVEEPGFIKGGLLWLSGVIIGFIPLILMILIIPGFAAPFWESICFLFEIKATNIPLAIPWPWAVNFSAVSFKEAVREVLIGFYFTAPVVFGVLSIIWVIRQRYRNIHVPPAIVAASFLALPYAHYAYSRADISHLAQGIFPTLLGFLIILSRQTTKIKWVMGITLFATSLLATLFNQPAWECFAGKKCVSMEISGSNLWLDSNTANDVMLLRYLDSKYAPNRESFIATPVMPGAYALLDRRSPMWEIYALLPHSQKFQQAEIERIKQANPRFVLMIDSALDGRDDLRFKNTHPFVYQYIQENLEKISDLQTPTYQIYLAK